MVKNSFIEKKCCRYTLELPSRGNSNVEPTTYVAENKEEKYLEIYTFQVSCPLSFNLSYTSDLYKSD